MFIVDALIGNEDRSNENWGFLYNTATDEITIAPVYGCGSSLYPQADDAIMRNALEDQQQRDIRTFSLPLSRIKIKNHQINYFDFISSLTNADCNESLKRVLPRINMDEIFRIVDETPFISDLQKRFYKTMLQTRKERILDFSMEKLLEREKMDCRSFYSLDDFAKQLAVHNRRSNNLPMRPLRWMSPAEVTVQYV